MQKNYFGSERLRLLEWLSGEWLTEGGLACFVEGFPGVGKSDLAAAVVQSAESGGWHTVYVEIPDQPNPSFFDALHVAAEQLADQGRMKMLTTLSEPNANSAFALERGLRDKTLIVIDEAGRLMDGNGQASAELSSVLSYLRHRPGLNGRMLFLSEVAVETERWSETFKIAKLLPPSVDEAVAMLTDRLHSQQCADTVLPDRMFDLVQVLGCNPRAIETLAVAMTFDRLDDIIGEDPGMWRVSDRDVSPEFLERLERRLLERTLVHLEPLKFKRLTMLAVHRKSFEQDAFSAVTSGARKEWRDLRNALISRFFVTTRLGWYSMNPVVRTISLARLKDDVAAFATAHSMAAEYHLRHFKSKQIVLESSRLTISYAELRYHLYNAGRVQELRDVTIRLRDHLTLIWSANSAIPQDKMELDERISVLSVLLEDEGPRPLEFYLARCLEARATKADLEQALIHITRVCAGRALVAQWLVKARIHERLGEIDQAIQVAVDALSVVEATDGIAALYKFGADLFSKTSRPADAIILLRAGILKVSPSNALFSLYLRLAELLEEQGKPDEALIVLKEGINRIPADQALFSLYHSAAMLLKRQNHAHEALELLMDGVRVIPPDKGASIIYQAAADMMQSKGDLGNAIELLRQGIRVIPIDKNVDMLYRMMANILNERGDTEEAVELLKTAIELSPLEKIREPLYRHVAELLLRSNRTEAGIEMLKRTIGAASKADKAVKIYRNAAELLKQTGHISSAVVLVSQGAQKFPDDEAMADLLRSLTEQSHETMTESARMKPDPSCTAGSRQTVLVMATEWRSVHGGLSTFNRQLCIALAALQHQVYCVVPQRNDQDVAHAEQYGIKLVVAEPTPGASELSGLSRRLQLPNDVLPSIIIGHGRITGAFAKDQQGDFFKGAKRIHFVHMAPGEIEWFKEPEKAAHKVDAREQIEVALASDAQLVAAVGPRLMREFSDLLRGSRPSPRVVEFVPGPVAIVEDIIPPHLNHCLVLGRADDYSLKGLDIAARAMSYLIGGKRYVGELPELVIRGATPGTSHELRNTLQSICDGIDVPMRIREYSAAENTIESDIRRAALMLMPSRREGFGLVALEALSQGTPVLVSDKSGFADIVRRLAPERLVLNTVVETPEDLDTAAKNWSDAISRQLTDKEAAFSRAKELGELLSREINWAVATRQLLDAVELL